MVSFIKNEHILCTYVGPKKIRDAIGLEGSFNPALDRCIDCVTTSIASFCPTTRSFNFSPMARTLFFSVSNILLSDMPVHVEITLAISYAQKRRRCHFDREGDGLRRVDPRQALQRRA